MNNDKNVKAKEKRENNLFKDYNYAEVYCTITTNICIISRKTK
jgi:hypothetical protein